MLRDARHVHVSQYFVQDRLRADLPALFDAVHGAGGTTSIDPNADPRDAWDAGLRDLLPRVDVFLPNEAEARAIGGHEDTLEAARVLPAATVVVKRGPDGALALAGDHVAETPGSTVDARDATGAGDSFDAGFLAAHLAGLPLEAALRLADACGALSTRALGGVDAQPTREEAERFLASTG
jgi:sugar/nucleoside kinase (ribokinase family)